MFVQQAMQGNRIRDEHRMPSQIALTNEFDEKEVGLPTMFVSAPLKDGDSVVGVVAFRIHVATLSNLLQRSKVWEDR